MLKRIAPALLLLACALLFLPAEAHADPIVVTNGFFSANAPSPGGSFRSYGYDFGGNNLSIRGVEPDAAGRQSVGWDCVPSPCAAGSTFTVNHRGGLFTWLPSTTLQFNGQTFTGRGMGALDFVTGALPWPPPAGESVITLTTHFTMSGAVHFEALNFNDNTWTQFFVADVVGSGVASIRLSRFSGFYFIDGVTYTFQDAVPTPEPATLLLLGSGLAGLAARRRRRRARHREAD